MGKREAKVEQYLSDCISSLGGLCRKWTSPGHTGVPDQIVILNGAVYFVEVKTEDGTTEPHQVREINRLRVAGANCFVVHGHNRVDMFIEMVKGK